MSDAESVHQATVLGLLEPGAPRCEYRSSAPAHDAELFIMCRNPDCRDGGFACKFHWEGKLQETRWNRVLYGDRYKVQCLSCDLSGAVLSDIVDAVPL